MLPPWSGLKLNLATSLREMLLLLNAIKRTRTQRCGILPSAGSQDD